VSTALGDALSQLRSDGWKAFVPYVTAGLPGVDGGFLRTLEEVGADAVEIGIPFSDPVMDGPVIQAASKRALEAGATVESAFKLAAEAALDVPVVIMTYLNPVLAYGEEEWLADAVACAVRGVIVPDLPVDEAGDWWIPACREAGLASVFLAAPNSTRERLEAVAEASTGFVYCVSTLGVTGARDRLAGSARSVVDALRPVTDRPLLVGVGISNPDQAREACTFADGVIVGTKIVAPLLRGDMDKSIRRAELLREACQ
jgi:tryptophan synthase alpha chain